MSLAHSDSANSYVGLRLVTSLPADNHNQERAGINAQARRSSSLHPLICSPPVFDNSCTSREFLRQLGISDRRVTIVFHRAHLRRTHRK